MNTNVEFKCVQCTKVVKTKRGLTKHINTMHKIIGDYIDVPSEISIRSQPNTLDDQHGINYLYLNKPIDRVMNLYVSELQANKMISIMEPYIIG